MEVAARATGGKYRNGVVWVEAAQRGSPTLPTQWRALYNVRYSSSSTGQRSLRQYLRFHRRKDMIART